MVVKDVASRYILSLLPFTTNTLIYEPSGCIISPADERSRRFRKPLIKRLLTSEMLTFSAYLIYGLAPLLLCLRIERTEETTGQVSLARTTRFPLAGPVVKLLDCVCAVSLPLRYMIFPPTVPEREELMEPDQAQVRRPKESLVQRREARSDWSWLDILEACLICWLYL